MARLAGARIQGASPAALDLKNGFYLTGF